MMKKELTKSMVILFLNIVTILVLAHENIFSNTIAISSEYITYNTLIAIILFLILVIIKTNFKVALITNISRLGFERTITLFTFMFFQISFLTVFIYTQQLDFLIGVFLITFEVIFIISMLLISANSLPISLSNKFIKLKDIVFTVMVIDLILKNQPFEFFSLPVASILIAAYTTISAYILYKLIVLLKKSF